MPDQSDAAARPLDDIDSPHVLSDNRVTIRIYAPKASEVFIRGDWVSHRRGMEGSLERDGQGVWSITIGPLVPDIYTYLLSVDGVPTLDPSNPNIKNSTDIRENYFIVLGDEMAFVDI